jgi:hypothetical protein
MQSMTVSQDVFRRQQFWEGEVSSEMGLRSRLEAGDEAAQCASQIRRGLDEKNPRMSNTNSLSKSITKSVEMVGERWSFGRREIRLRVERLHTSGTARA